MHSYPVHYHIAAADTFSRLQVAIRVVAFAALGILGISFGVVFVFAYLALPAYAASRLAHNPGTYLDCDGPRVLRVLRWFAAVSAWAGLIAEHLPGQSPDEHVRVVIDGRPHPNAISALGRVVTGLPSALVLAVLGAIGVLVWLWAALSILVAERVGPHAFRYLEGLQRWSIRLLVYQAALVDDYPPFSFADTPPAVSIHT